MVSDYFFGIFKLLYENDLSEYVSVSNNKDKHLHFLLLTNTNKKQINI